VNFFRFGGRGDFFGIIIPGAFLLLNLILLFPESTKAVWEDNELITFSLLFILSYIFGIALRA
jgi:hypothetical protein